VGRPILSLGASSVLLFGSLQSARAAEFQDAVKEPISVLTAQAPAPNDKETSLLPGQFVLRDATPIFLRISRNVSSADAHVGDSVDFEVLEDVAVDGILVIPKGSAVAGRVTEAQSKRRMGRAGKLEIILDYVRLANDEKTAIRAVKEVKGANNALRITAGIVGAGLLFFPVAPLFLLIRGNDITVPKGAAMAAYVNGDVRLESSEFRRVRPEAVPSRASSWLLQSEHVVGDSQEGFRKTCDIISPSGEYHREERKQVPTGIRGELEWAPTRVFESKLTQAELDALRAILATPEMHSISGVVGDGGSLRSKLVLGLEGAVQPREDVEIVTIAVARAQELQLFEVADIFVARKQVPLSELLDWLAGSEHLPQERLLASEATNCAAPVAAGSSETNSAAMAARITFAKPIVAHSPQLPHGTPKPQPVAVEVLINPDGSVAKASLESRTSPEVAQSVLNAVLKWEFQPARLLGVPVADTVHLKVVEFQEQ